MIPKLLLATFFALLFLIPARIVVQRVPGQDAVQRMDEDDQDKQNRRSNRYVFPIHSSVPMR
ncbi:hypothetical protein UFOVP935_16 [uncultured Caudovirales phage]|uniref:Uncharacterized protein n=1 Tax=uncultured Caudovirales phage TaxID=2100421 RepID=A0A6J5PTQ6_9CAUD|nr:hypothetical protein UFOVP935_16 [uncultured Caudovirales phage]